MPKPRKGESKSDYISRAIAYMVKNEGLSKDQAAGKAYGMWRNKLAKMRLNHKKKGR